MGCLTECQKLAAICCLDQLPGVTRTRHTPPQYVACGPATSVLTEARLRDDDACSMLIVIEMDTCAILFMQQT